MINRIIIRIKVLQIVYAYYQNSKDLSSAENELLHGLQKSYDLYHYLLLLIPLLTDAEQKRLDKQKNKFLATESELNPNRRLENNRFAEQLRTNKQLQKFANEKGALWNDEDLLFLRHILNEILQSDIYLEYLQSDDNYESDKEFWLKVFKSIIWDSDELTDFLEDRSIYWDDDLGVVGTFVLKTLKRFSAETNTAQALLPMFKDLEDKQFAIDLLCHSLREEDENNRRITKQISNWDIERIAQIDLYIMQIALAEIRNFPSIPVNVTLNEYIDLARYYSTPKSSVFINGILDAIVKELKSEGLLFKN
ncbi:N utilization substance protein B [Bacteroidia bacterium]|nr:N utilization substance protein B [Bacteroidia bacterium]